MTNIYVEEGYTDREDYLESLAMVWGAPPSAVKELAEILGEEEDFDGLAIAVEDQYGSSRLLK